MPISKLYAGVTYVIPLTGEINWGGLGGAGTGLNDFFAALADNTVTLSGAQSLSNKTLSASTLNDSNTTWINNADNTKILKFSAAGITTGTTRTLTAPNASSTIAVQDPGVGGQTLSNTTLDNSSVISVKDGSLTIQGTADTTKHLVFSLAGSTTGKTSTFASSNPLDATYTLPTATTTLVGTDSTQTLTNKSISGSTNTITNVSLTAGVTGTLPIGNGGTNATTANPAFNNLSPLTTKGDLIGYSTVNARLAVGTDGQVLTADSASTLGIKWATAATVPAAGDVYSDGTALQRVAFTAATNRLFGENNAGTAGIFKTMATGTTGTDFAVVAADATITYNLPAASSTASGKITFNTNQTIGVSGTASAKTFAGGAKYTTFATAASGAGDYVITDTDGYDSIKVTPDTGNVKITLPLAANNTGRYITVYRTDTNGNQTATGGSTGGTSTRRALISWNASDTGIDYATTNDSYYLTAQYSYATFYSDGGTVWHVVRCWDQVESADTGDPFTTTGNYKDFCAVLVGSGMWTVCTDSQISTGTITTSLDLGVRTSPASGTNMTGLVDGDTLSEFVHTFSASEKWPMHNTGVNFKMTDKGTIYYTGSAGFSGTAPSFSGKLRAVKTK